MNTVKKNKVIKPRSKPKSKLRPISNVNKKELISIHQISKIAMVYWIGGCLMIATIILPMMFKVLDIVTATQLVGSILNIVAYIGMIALFMALFEVIVNHKLALLKTKRFWYILSMISLLFINYFAIFPVATRLRQQISNVAHQIVSVQSNVFDFWHSLSAVTFVVTCILGVLYLIEM